MRQSRVVDCLLQIMHVPAAENFRKLQAVLWFSLLTDTLHTMFTKRTSDRRVVEQVLRHRCT